MKAFANVDARQPRDAVARAAAERDAGRSVAFVAGGSDLLGQMKRRLIQPDVLVNLKTIPGLDGVSATAAGVCIGGLVTLDALARHDGIRERYAALAQAAESVATPQIRNVATLAGNICQRPWCWYYREGFRCFKNGGQLCYSITGENQFHAIFGGGPSFIVHPSDTASALVAMDARFRLVGPAGERRVPAAEFFTLPSKDPARENVLEPDELLAEVILPPSPRGTRSLYTKILDREAWTHAVVSVAASARRRGAVFHDWRIVLGGVAPVPWRVPAVEGLLEGQRVTPERAAQAAGRAVAGAAPLERNRYKVALTRSAVERTLLRLAEHA